MLDNLEKTTLLPTIHIVLLGMIRIVPDVLPAIDLHNMRVGMLSLFNLSDRLGSGDILPAPYPIALVAAIGSVIVSYNLGHGLLFPMLVGTA